MPAKKSATPTQAMKRSVEAAHKGYDEAVQSAYYEAVQSAKEQVDTVQEQAKKSSAAMANGYQDLAALNRDNIEAVVRSSAVVAKGVESLSRGLMAYAQQSIGTNIATANAIFGARSLREVIDVQNEFARSGFGSFWAESAKLTDMSLRVASDAMAPLQARFKLTMERMTSPIDDR